MVPLIAFTINPLMSVIVVILAILIVQKIKDEQLWWVPTEQKISELIKYLRQK